MENGLAMKSVLCLEELARPCHLEVATYLTSVLLAFNDKMECRLICAQTNRVISTVKGPACGPVSSTQYLTVPFSPEEVMLFTASDSIGLMKLPLDGNPFRIVSHKAGGQGRVVSVCPTEDRRRAFSLGEDGALILWKLDISVVNHLESAGGEGTSPYLKALQLKSGRPPSLEDMELMFAAVRELSLAGSGGGGGSSGGSGKEPPPPINALPLSEVPAFIRSLGLFPTAHELDMLRSEWDGHGNPGEEGTEITFDECLKLYWNEKDCLGYTEAEIEGAFACLCEEYSSRPYSEVPYLSREDFLRILQNEGYSGKVIAGFLSELLREAVGSDLGGSDIISHIPQRLDYKYFLRTLLGLAEHNSIIEDENNVC